MVYRFKLVSDEVRNFSREIEIDSENTFLQLRNSILESVGYTKDELDSFLLCDDDWEPQDEVTMEEMGTMSSDRDQFLMDNTPISELVEEEGQKMIFEYDYDNQRGFFMELKEIIPGRSLVEPLCTIKRGNAPRQLIHNEEQKSPIETPVISTSDVDPLDLGSFGDETFDNEDIDTGFDIMNLQ